MAEIRYGFGVSRMVLTTEITPCGSNYRGQRAAPANSRGEERRTLLQAYVAPRALLFVTDPGTGVERTTFTLSTCNTSGSSS
jgi:hypothetical protein